MSNVSSIPGGKLNQNQDLSDNNPNNDKESLLGLRVGGSYIIDETKTNMKPVGKDIVLQNKSKDKKFQIGQKANKKGKSKTKTTTFKSGRFR